MAHLSGDTLLISGDGYGNADGNGGGNGGRKLFAMALIAADARRNKLGNGIQLRRNWLSMCEVRRRRLTEVCSANLGGKSSRELANEPRMLQLGGKITKVSKSDSALLIRLVPMPVLINIYDADHLLPKGFLHLLED